MSVSLFIDPDLTEKTGKILAFFITVASMTLAFNLIPLLPSPNPALSSEGILRSLITPSGAGIGLLWASSLTSLSVSLGF